MGKQTIGVFFGSRSAEHDVSIITAIASVIKPLKALGEYEVIPVYIAKTGQWYSHPKFAEINTYRTGEVDELMHKLSPVGLEIGNGLRLLYKVFRGYKSKTIDIAFPATHGTYGEDGSLMGIFEMASVPYIGCDVSSSAISMNKVLSKKIAICSGISTPIFETANSTDLKPNNIEKFIEYIISRSSLKNIRLPWFVKPAHLGSSIGITKVESKSDLRSALEVAAHYDHQIIIEEGVKNLIEVTVPVIGNDELRIGLVEKPLSSGDSFFDFDKKYLNNGKKSGKRGSQIYSELPAKLPPGVYEKCQEVAKKVFRSIGCQGIARVDLLIDSKETQVYFNEINPLPGSLYFHNWNKAGVSSSELVKELIGYAKKRQQEKIALNTVFHTNYLKQF